MAEQNHTDVPSADVDVQKQKPEKECWEELCNAVVLQAVDDYRRLVKRLLRTDDDNKVARLKKRKRELETFFRSDWFNMFTTLDGKMILKKLQEEMDGDD